MTFSRHTVLIRLLIFIVPIRISSKKKLIFNSNAIYSFHLQNCKLLQDKQNVCFLHDIDASVFENQNNNLYNILTEKFTFDLNQ